MAIITIEGMIFRAAIGVYPAERVLGNEIEVSVKLAVLPDKEPVADLLSRTIDYEQVYALVREVIAEPMHLLETAVKKISDSIVQHYPSVNMVKVRVSKLNPPLKGRVKKVWVEDTWLRGAKK
ncbi:MAG TPA: dihydroneopterin aldolase [Chitinophagales bacterium]|nr:dihydroneopterin aldolase [Chitinophagales bacterium]